MMNRIILIGNGFDLAHGLPTSYKDFIEDYWVQYGEWLSSCLGRTVKDDLCTISLENEDSLGWYDIIPHCNINGQKPPSPKEIIEEIKEEPAGISVKKTPFFQLIDTVIEIKNWVDIEYEYYQQLKCIFKDTAKLFDCPQKLDMEFEAIEFKLKAYLAKIQEKKIKPDLKIEDIRDAIYEPFSVQDISNSGNKKFKEFLSERMNFMATNSQETITGFLNKYGYSYLDRHSDIDLYNEQIINREGFPGLSEPLNYPKHIRNVYDGNGLVPDVYLLPDQILFLNFNYTSTADLYIPQGSEFEVNHIHGELGNDKNPIIFGYGDELDEDYKEISKLNDNDYLKNIKSIRYLETDNYRKLLSFIDSAPFQIYIMGHSCGNSDRTLLNTLFEHKNCVSIKPFYHQKDDGTDNYIEIIQNISRNFNDMRLMRDRVVNKTYCRPLVQQEK